MMNDKGDDGVIIATPTRTHFSLAQKALRAGKHVLIEKPMTMSFDEAKQLVVLGASLKKIVMVDHTFLFNDAVIKIRNLIKKGSLGKILYIDSVRANLGLFQSDVNAVFDLASHDFSIIQFLLDAKVQSINATGKAHYNNQEDVAYIIAQYPQDIMAHIHVSWLSPLKIRRMLIVGTKKMVMYDDTEQAEKVKVYDKGVVMNVTDQLAEQIKVNYRSGDVWLPKIDIIEPLGMLINTYVTAMTQKYKKEIKSGGSFPLNIMEILEASTKSMRSGRKVTL